MLGFFNQRNYKFAFNLQSYSWCLRKDPKLFKTVITLQAGSKFQTTTQAHCCSVWTMPQRRGSTKFLSMYWSSLMHFRHRKCSGPPWFWKSPPWFQDRWPFSHVETLKVLYRCWAAMLVVMGLCQLLLGPTSVTTPGVHQQGSKPKLTCVQWGEQQHEFIFAQTCGAIKLTWFCNTLVLKALEKEVRPLYWCNLSPLLVFL